MQKWTLTVSVNLFIASVSNVIVNIYLETLSNQQTIGIKRFCWKKSLKMLANIKCWNINLSTVCVLFSISEKNRTNQSNPTHEKSGPGHETGYKGDGSKPDLDNHGNQLNPNHPEYKGKKWTHSFRWLNKIQLDT